ncbi:MAG: hypothetical protein ABI035_04735 [Gemmatimonadaceae bacterium]
MSLFSRMKNLPPSLPLWMTVAVVAMLIGCTHASTAADPSADSSIITQEQIEPLHATDAYDVVAALRPNFLHSRGRESADPRVAPVPVRVYVDDTSYGDANSLRGIPIGQIEEIRFYQSYDAQQKFGTGNAGGVIQVVTKR